MYVCGVFRMSNYHGRIKFHCLRCADPFDSFKFVGRVKSTEYKVQGVCINPECSECKNE